MLGGYFIANLGGYAMDIVMMKLSELVPYDKNPRKNDEAVKYVKASIQEFGFKVPIVIDKDNVIIAGHTRYKASKELKIDEVPCIIASDLTEEQIKAFRLADNKVSEQAEWDLELLSEELDDLFDFDMGAFGFELESEEEDVEIQDDEYEIEPPAEPRAKLGDIYQLGNHRLMCGDSTSIDDVEKLMDGNKADMVFTDPPYLMGFTGNVHGDGTKSFNSKHGAIKNDKMSRQDGDNFILKIFENIQRFNKGAYYVCFYRLGLDYIFRALDKLDNQYKALIIWNKGNHTLSNSDYMSKYEPIVYGWFDSHLFYGDRRNFDIWDIQRTQKNDLHPTMKPIALCSKAIENSSKKEDIVLDLFGGSGSTLIACEQLNRHAYLMELDPKYVDVIIDRWEQYTGQKAQLLTEGEV
jgi:site-specific DNA-methyltransferase (adenine-specific)